MIRTMGTLYVVLCNVPDDPYETVSLPSSRSLKIKALCLNVKCGSDASNLLCFYTKIVSSFLFFVSTVPGLCWASGCLSRSAGQLLTYKSKSNQL